MELGQIVALSSCSKLAEHQLSERLLRHMGPHLRQQLYCCLLLQVVLSPQIFVSLFPKIVDSPFLWTRLQVVQPFSPPAPAFPPSSRLAWKLPSSLLPSCSLYSKLWQPLLSSPLSWLPSFLLV